MPIGRTGPILGAIGGAVNPPEGLSAIQGLFHGLLSGIPAYRLGGTILHALQGTTGQFGNPANNPYNHPENFGGMPIVPANPSAPPTFTGDPTDPTNPANYQLTPPGGAGTARPSAPPPSSLDAFDPGGWGLNSFTRTLNPYNPDARPSYNHPQGVPNFAQIISSWIRGRNQL